MRVLVVEDAKTVSALEQQLKTQGHIVTSENLLAEVILLATELKFDIILLSTDFPNTSGLNAVKALRNNNVSTPILVLSNIDENVQIELLAVGADRCIGVPFELSELVAHMKAIVRLSTRNIDLSTSVGNLKLNRYIMDAEVNAERVFLTPVEYKVLELLMNRTEIVITRDLLLDHLYGGVDEPSMKTIENYISRLREKLAGATCRIETVWGLGYKLTLRPSPVKIQKAHRARGTVSEMIVRQLSEQPGLRSKELVGSFSGIKNGTLHKAVTGLLKRGRIQKMGTRQPHTYELTSLGKSWLRSLEQSETDARN